jgi:serine/threonine protein kinase
MSTRPNASESRGDAVPTGDELVDRMVGEFRLIRRLGKGGMAEVYLAEQTSLKRNVAIKVLRHRDDQDIEQTLKRFKAEALAAAGLSHPNIVQVYMVGEDRGTHFIAQEYVQGYNLREYLQRKGPPDAQLALHIMKQVAAALQAAGQAGIVHRDIKPENIMLTKRGEVKVADFGLAQLVMGGERLNLTQTGMTMGTPLYMSPEQVSGSKLDQRSDLYSLGVTFYHLLAGQPPFNGETAVMVAMKHLNDKAAPLHDARADLPAALCDLIHQLLEKKPEDRPENAQVVLKEIKRISQERAGQAEAAQGASLHLSVPQLPKGAVNRGNAESSPPSAARMRVSQTMQTVFEQADNSLGSQLWPLVLAMLLAAGAAAAVGWLTRPGNPLRNTVKIGQSVPSAVDLSARVTGFEVARFTPAAPNACG